MKKFVKRKPVKKEKIPMTQKKVTKTMKRLIAWGFVFVGCSGMLSLLLFVGMRGTVSSVNQKVSQLESQIKGGNGASISLTPEIESFMNRFVALYMNISEDPTIQKEREQLLSEEYYASGMTMQNTNVSIQRKLDSASFVSLKKIHGVKTASYQVTYTIEQKKEKDETVKSTETQVLNLPYESSNKGCRIISYPYFTLPIKNQEKASYLTFDDKKYSLVDSKNSEKILDFSKDFLSKYAKNSASDMEYMMKKPEGLEGTAEFDSLIGKVFEREQEYLLKGTATFKNPETGYSWQEDLTLVIEEKSGKYYVNEMDHTL